MSRADNNSGYKTYRLGTHRTVPPAETVARNRAMGALLRCHMAGFYSAVDRCDVESMLRRAQFIETIVAHKLSAPSSSTPSANSRYFAQTMFSRCSGEPKSRAWPGQQDADADAPSPIYQSETSGFLRQTEYLVGTARKNYDPSLDRVP